MIFPKGVMVLTFIPSNSNSTIEKMSASVNLISQPNLHLQLKQQRHSTIQVAIIKTMPVITILITSNAIHTQQAHKMQTNTKQIHIKTIAQA